MSEPTSNVSGAALATDDLGGAFVANKAGAEASRLQGVFDDFSKTVKPPTASTQEEVDPYAGYKTVGKMYKDIGKGLVYTPLEVVGGARNALQEVLNKVDHAADWANENIVDLDKLLTGQPADIAGKPTLPEVPGSGTITGGLIRGVAQFATGFALTRRALGANFGVASGSITSNVLASGLANPLVFDLHEQNLSNLIKDRAPALENPVTDYLAANPNDTNAEAALKKTIEGLGLGALGEGLTRGIAAIKANRIEKGVTPQPGKFTAIRAKEQPTDKGAVSYDIMDRTGKDIGFAELTLEGDTAYVNLIDSYGSNLELSMADKKPLATGPNTLGKSAMRGMVKKLVEDYPQVRFISGERISGARERALFEKGTEPGDVPLTVVPVPEYMTRGLGEPEEPIVTQLGHPDEPVVLQTTDSQANAFLGSRQSQFKQPFQYNWSRFSSSEEIQGAIDDTSQLFSDKINEARRGKIADEDLKDMAAQLNVTPQDLLNVAPGKAYAAEEIIARKTMLEAATTKLLETARTAQNSSDAADLFAFRKMLDIHAGIQAHLQGAASEAGRALRALQVPAGSTEKQIAQIEEMLMKDGGPDVTRRLAGAISELNDPSKIPAIVNGSLGKRLTDAVVEAWYFNLLSGPQTQIVNFLSNGLNTVWQVPERALAAGFSSIRGTANGIRAGETAAMLHGIVSAQRAALITAGKALLTGEATQGVVKVETRIPEAITSAKFPIGKTIGGPVGTFVDSSIDALGTFMRVPTRALLSADEYFKVIGKTMQSQALAFRKAANEGLEGEAFARRVAEQLEYPSSSMIDSAQAFANDLTFTTKLGPSGQGIQNWIGKHPAVKFVAPFITTPANIFKWVGKRSPLALLSRGFYSAIKSGGPNGDLALAQLTLGSSVSLIMTDFAMRGHVTGAGPNDPDLRQTWMRTHQPFSVKAGGNWYSYNRFDPFGMMLGAAATYGEVSAYSNIDTLGDLAYAIGAASSRSVFSKTWLRTPADLADVFVSNDQNKWARFLQRFTGSLIVPAGVAQFTHTADPVWREVNSLTDAVKSRTPGLSADLPPWRNLWGQKVLLEGGLGPDIVSPIYKSQDEDRPIDKWMLANRLNVKKASKLQNEVELTPKQQDRFDFLAGNGMKDPLTGLGTYDTLNAMIAGTHPDSYAWSTSTDGPEGGRAAIVRKVIEKAREAARGQLYDEDAEFRNRANARQIEKGTAFDRTIMRPSASAAPQ